MKEEPNKQSQIFRPLLILRYDKSDKPVGLYKFTDTAAVAITGRILLTTIKRVRFRNQSECYKINKAFLALERCLLIPKYF